MQAEQWKQQGALIEVNGFKHFVYDSKTDKPVLLILHGYPTCVYDYHKSLTYLESEYRVVMHDHLGFGYSDKPMEYSYSLIEQTDQALMLWHQLGIDQACILAHDYGTSIATELLARRCRFKDFGFNWQKLVLCNGSMHIELAQLRLIQKLLLNPITGPWVAKLSNRNTLARNLRNIYHDKSLLTDEEIDALWIQMTHQNGKKVLHKTTQYIRQRRHYWHRWIGALRNTDLPISIVWAKNDPVAVIEMAKTLFDEVRNSQLIELDALGHFPMLENPAVWSEAVLKSLSAQR